MKHPSTAFSMNRSVVFQSTEGSVRNIMSKCENLNGLVKDERMGGCFKETDTEHQKAIDRIVKRYKSVSDESKEY